MLKTLQGYLVRDLLRVSGLALVAFTLVMTVFSILEPLRKEGLATSQVAELFLYTMPVMLSLTLPFAVLFATTIVYGRFAQDREMLACRASGISTLTVLKPALVLGVLVTIISLLMTNFVSPRMARAAQDAIFQNMRRILYNKIDKEGHAEIGRKYLLHATFVDEENDILYGVVMGECRLEKDPDSPKGKIPFLRALVARRAYLKTQRVTDPVTGREKYVASVNPIDHIGPLGIDFDKDTGEIISQSRITQGELPLQGAEIPNPTQSKARFYNWKQMIRIYQDPAQHPEIQKMMEEYRRMTWFNRAMRDLSETIQSGKPYDRLLRGDDRKFVFRAPKASFSRQGAKLRATGTPGKNFKPVIIENHGPDGKVIVTRAHRAVFSVGWNEFLQQEIVSISVPEGQFISSTVHADPKTKPKNVSWGGFRLPPDPEMDDEAIISKLYNHPEDYTDDVKILKRIESVRKYRPPKIRAKILAEMHTRISFGLSCAVLVALGAALGLIFRGGQMITAFVLSVIPGAATIIMVLMGKKMIENVDASDLGGMIAVWGGNGLLLVAVIGIYYGLSRK